MPENPAQNQSGQAFPRIMRVAAIAAALSISTVLVAEADPAIRALEFPGLTRSAADSQARLLTADLGMGEALYLGGSFGTACGESVGAIAGYQPGAPDEWFSLGNEIGNVLSLIAFDESGSGRDELYVTIRINAAKHPSILRFQKWNGSQWIILSQENSNDFLRLLVHDAGNGPEIYGFRQWVVDSTAQRFRLQRWTGSAWQVLDESTTTPNHLPVLSIRSLPDPVTGARTLFLGGSFRFLNGRPHYGLARWDGAIWQPLGQGVAGNISPRAVWPMVRDLTVFDDGSGPRLFITGDFRTVDGITAHSFAAWDGFTWQAVGGGLSGSGYALHVHDDGSGEALYVGGDFAFAGDTPANSIARWNGRTFESLAQGVNGLVTSLVSMDAGGASSLAVNGGFSRADGIPSKGLARWHSGIWLPTCADGLGTEVAWVRVTALETTGNAENSAIYAGGIFDHAGGVCAPGFASAHNGVWSATRVDVLNQVDVIREISLGGETALYVGGKYTFIADSGARFYYIARFNGMSLESMGQGLNSVQDSSMGVRGMTAFDDGNGPALHIVGRFFGTGSQQLRSAARFRSNQWQPLGSTLESPSGQTVTLDGLGEFDDGTGTRLHVSGEFNWVGWPLLQTANGLARWDGEIWSPAPVPPSLTARRMVVFDPPGSAPPAIYYFSLSNFMRWDGVQHVVMDNPPLGLIGMAVVQLRSGQALFGYGRFDDSVTGERYGIARFDGVRWHRVESRIESAFNPQFSNMPSVHAIAPYPGPGGTQLLIGGTFDRLNGREVGNIGVIDLEPTLPDADLNGDGIVNAADLGILLGSWGPCTACPADLNFDGVVGAADLGILLGAWG